MAHPGFSRPSRDAVAGVTGPPALPSLIPEGDGRVCEFPGDFSGVSNVHLAFSRRSEDRSALGHTATRKIF